MADDKPLDARAIRLEVTVPCDERFRPVLGVLCARMARYVGYGDVQAEELASAVVHATDGVLEHEESPQYTSLDVTIATSSSEIEFRVRYLWSLALWPIRLESGGTRTSAMPAIERASRCRNSTNFGRKTRPAAATNSFNLSGCAMIASVADA